MAIKGSVEANNGDTLNQLAAQGVGITRIGTIAIQDELQSGALIPILEEFNPGDVEEINAVFVGGAHTPVRVRCFVDFLVESLRR
jgi:DNA-binding transcriptional LysR family regulator